jgi:rRNA maturation endonuclease Nob1
MKIKREEITEEVRYVWECPKCSHFNEGCDDPDYMDEIMCEECGEDLEIED